MLNHRHMNSEVEILTMFIQVSAVVNKRCSSHINKYDVISMS